MVKLKVGLWVAGLAVASSCFLAGAAAPWQAPAALTPGPATAAGLPPWAYPVAPAGADTTPTPGDSAMQHVAGSTAVYSAKQIADQFAVPDWFPDTHPAMPAVVAAGRKPAVMACGYCHLPNGLGRPENANLAGLPVAYMTQQLSEFKDGSRHSSEPRMISATHMVQVAKAATDAEMQAGVEYFASLSPSKWVRVVETDTVPKTRIAGGMLVPATPAATEPIGERVIEVPEDARQTELRNPKSGFVAYVPKGSVKLGEALVTTGGDGETLACTICHGMDLKGMSTMNSPSLAGRSPSQVARQLIDFQDGSRGGPGAALMMPVVMKLTNADIVNITAYLASLEP